MLQEQGCTMKYRTISMLLGLTSGVFWGLSSEPFWVGFWKNLGCVTIIALIFFPLVLREITNR